MCFKVKSERERERERGGGGGEAHGIWTDCCVKHGPVGFPVFVLDLLCLPPFHNPTSKLFLCITRVDAVSYTPNTCPLGIMGVPIFYFFKIKYMFIKK